MSENKDKKVTYGFIKPTLQQGIYTIVLIALIAIACTPPVRSILVMQITLSQWILFVLCFTFPVISIVRMQIGKRKK